MRNYEDMRLRLKETTEENRASEKQNRELVSNISHDLKTPITAIKGYVEGIMDGVAVTPEKMDKYQLLYEFVHLIVIDACALYGAPLPEARQALEDIIIIVLPLILTALAFCGIGLYLMNAQKGFPIVRLDYTTMTENARQAAPPGQSSPCRLQLISTTISYFSQESVK